MDLSTCITCSAKIAHPSTCLLIRLRRSPLQRTSSIPRLSSECLHLDVIRSRHMADTLNREIDRDRTERTYVERGDDSSAGWAVAVIVLIAVIAVGIFFWMRARSLVSTPAAPNTGTSINVTVPTPSTNGSSNNPAGGSGSTGSGTKY